MSDNFADDEFGARKSGNQKHMKKNIDAKKQAKKVINRIDNRGVTHVPDEEGSDNNGEGTGDDSSQEETKSEDEEEEEDIPKTKNGKKNRRNKSEKNNQSPKTNSSITSPLSNMSSPTFASGADIGFGFENQEFPEEKIVDEDPEAKKKRLKEKISSLFVNGCDIRKRLRPKKSNAWDIFISGLDLSDKDVRNALLSEVKKGCGINGCIKVENNEEIIVFTTGDGERIIDYLVSKLRVNRSFIKSHI